MYSFEPFYSNQKESWDYNDTTDSMSGHDTNAPIRENPLDYDENVHNQNETASPPNLAPTEFPKHDDILGLHSKEPHLMVNSTNGAQIWILPNGKGGAMGWAPYQEGTPQENIKWDTHDLYKVEQAIRQGLYQEQQPIFAKVARKAFSPSQQKELVEENPNSIARNRHKLNLSNSHYEKKEEIEDDYLWLW